MLIWHNEISKDELLTRIRRGSICLGGNARLKIYGRLNCNSGKRMKKENRVFFSSANEATAKGFRPCGHCMTQDYKNWKNVTI